MNQRKKGFIIHENFYEQICLLTMEERGELLTAMFEYHREGKQPQGLTPLLAMAFTGVRQAMDQDREAYERRCEAGRANGKKGGRPRKNPAKEPSEKPKKGDMDMDMEMDMDMDMDMVMDMDMAMDMEMDMDMGRGFAAKADSVAEPPSGPLSEHPSGSLSEPLPEHPSEQPSGYLSESLSEPPSGPLSEHPSGSPSGYLSEEQKEDLKKLGVPSAYLAEREERACLFGRANGRDPSEVLLDWWMKDRPAERRRGRPKKGRSETDPGKTYDLDEFFEAALQRGMRLLE